MVATLAEEQLRSLLAIAADASLVVAGARDTIAVADRLTDVPHGALHLPWRELLASIGGGEAVE